MQTSISEQLDLLLVVAVVSSAMKANAEVTKERKNMLHFLNVILLNSELQT